MLFFFAEVEYRTKMGLTKTGDGDHGMHRSIVATQQQVNPEIKDDFPAIIQ